MGNLAAGQYVSVEFPLPYSLEDIEATLRRVGGHVQQSGRGPGSLEDDTTAGLDYIVMTTSGIREYLPELWDAYTDPEFVAWVSETVGEPVTPVEGEQGLNLNFVLANGRYELHYDSNPYTVLVFVTSLMEDQGGRLALYEDADGEPVEEFVPESGHAVLFDGSITPHRVTETEQPRITMPLLYLPTRVAEEDDTVLTGYLYES